MATTERVPLRKLYRTPLLHVLIIFTRSMESLAAVHSSKNRSHSFFDLETIIMAGAVRLKWNIGALSRVKSKRWRPRRRIDNLLRELETGQGMGVCEQTKSKV